MLPRLLLLAVAACGAASVASAARDVTNEDLRSAILALAHITKESADKLTGHDRREQAVADQLKRSLTGVDRRLNAVDEPLRGMEGRLARLESTIKDMEARSSSAVERQGTALTGIQKSLQELAFHPGVVGGPEPGEAVAVVPVGQALGEEILAAVQRLEQRTASVVREAVESAALRQQNETQALVQALTGSLTAALASAVTDQVLQRLEQQQQRRAQESKAAAEEAKSELLEAIGGIVTDSHAGMVADVAKSYEALSKELGALSSVERVLVQTGDNVIDAKRRVEYGVHQILLEVGSLIKQQSTDLNETLNSRFDVISGDILSHQTENLGNLSAKIETEISQVWRQIGIMYEQLTASKSMLDRLQHQTEIYVNGSLQTMDGMEGKVGQITSRMGEVDDNLNYLMGRLSLVTQEFNQIKTGLSSALDSIRKSFLELQGQVQDIGPGPNPIPEEPQPPAMLPPARSQSHNQV
ncbi:hypothetical protein ONE63_002839 [Megalurothrips usitatus]|uniref:Uncharacterized protein n=1 Tax=Megalurothrips usitatus TaxID=439358 RepID=A0AAV7XBH1_9NEOP|nr:hypothetical protein ONE63_002839 [Megalurothrips usitatus]